MNLRLLNITDRSVPNRMYPITKEVYHDKPTALAFRRALISMVSQLVPHIGCGRDVTLESSSGDSETRSGRQRNIYFRL